MKKQVWLQGGLAVVAAMWVLGCSGGGEDLPTAPSPPALPVAISVDLTYWTNHLTTDPDHFRIRICRDGSNQCVGGSLGNPALRTPGRITWTGSVAPGRYSAQVMIWEVAEYIDLGFTGSVVRNSVRIWKSLSGPVDVYQYRPCGVRTTWTTRRPDLWSGYRSDPYEIEFWFDVGAATEC